MALRSLLLALLAASAFSGRVPSSPFAVPSQGPNCSATLLTLRHGWVVVRGPHSRGHIAGRHDGEGGLPSHVPRRHNVGNASYSGYTAWLQELRQAWGVVTDAEASLPNLLAHLVPTLGDGGYILGDAASANTAIAAATALRAVVVFADNEATARAEKTQQDNGRPRQGHRLGDRDPK